MRVSASLTRLVNKLRTKNWPMRKFVPCWPTSLRRSSRSSSPTRTCRVTTATLNALHNQYVTGTDADNTTALHEAVRKYVAQMTCNHHLSDAEDVTGDIVAEVWRSLPNFRGDSSFSTWLHRLSNSAIIDRIRRERPGRI